MSSIDYDQDEQDYQQLQDYIPKDLMNMIIGYVPLVEFGWKPVSFTYNTKWNTNVYWNGQFTFGQWTISGARVHANRSTIDWYHAGDDCYSHFSFGNGADIKFIISLLKGESHLRPVTQQQVIEALYRFYNGDSSKYEDFEFNDTYTYLMLSPHWSRRREIVIHIIKVPPQLIIAELQFISDTITKHPFYNTRVLDFDRPTRGRKRKIN